MMPDVRPLFLTLALEAAPLGVVRLARPAWRKSAYVATLVVEPDGERRPICCSHTGRAVESVGGLHIPEELNNGR